MKYMYELKEKLCHELDEIAKKPDMSAGDLETVHKLTDTIKNIDKIDMLEDNEYSQAGNWEMDGRSSYGRGSSYANRRGTHYVRGHYSREGSSDDYSNEGGNSYRSMRGGNRGGYSRGDGRERMMEHMQRMMDEAGNDREREIIRRCMEQLESA